MNSLERYRQRVRDVENSPSFLVEDVKLSFAEELTRLLAQQGVSRTQLAERMKTSRAYVTRILRTDYNLTAATMVKVASALNARVSLHLSPADAELTQWYDLLPAANPTQVQVEPCWPQECGQPLAPASVSGSRNERAKAATAA